MLSPIIVPGPAALISSCVLKGKMNLSMIDQPALEICALVDLFRVPNLWQLIFHIAIYNLTLDLRLHLDLSWKIVEKKVPLIAD